MIKKIIKGMVNWAFRETPTQKEIDYSSSLKVKSSGNFTIGSGAPSIGSSVNGMNLVVYSANGGKVIQINQYDSVTDRMKNSLYIITDKEDLGEELGLIITKECLIR